MSRIKQLREKQGLSQADLARRLSVKQQTVSSWECGAKSPRAKKMRLLANELGCTVDELLEPDGAAADEATGTEN